METVEEHKLKVVSKVAITIGVFLLFVFPHYSFCKDFSFMYEKEILVFWQPRYTSNINWNLENVVKPVLRSEERITLENVKIEFPLIGLLGQPFEYGSKVVFRLDNKKQRFIVIFPISSK